MVSVLAQRTKENGYAWIIFGAILLIPMVLMKWNDNRLANKRHMERWSEENHDPIIDDIPTSV